MNKAVCPPRVDAGELKEVGHNKNNSRQPVTCSLTLVAAGKTQWTLKSACPCTRLLSDWRKVKGKRQEGGSLEDGNQQVDQQDVGYQEVASHDRGSQPGTGDARRETLAILVKQVVPTRR